MTDNRFNGICPICGRSYRGRPATSRTDNSTPICPDCGTRQALESIGIQANEREKILEIIHHSYTECEGK